MIARYAGSTSNAGLSMGVFHVLLYQFLRWWYRCSWIRLLQRDLPHPDPLPGCCLVPRRHISVDTGLGRSGTDSPGEHQVEVLHSLHLYDDGQYCHPLYLVPEGQFPPFLIIPEHRVRMAYSVASGRPRRILIGLYSRPQASPSRNQWQIRTRVIVHFADATERQRLNLMAAVVAEDEQKRGGASHLEKLP